jgi:tetratricopeptide (TPR) repeat protein
MTAVMIALLVGMQLVLPPIAGAQDNLWKLETEPGQQTLAAGRAPEAERQLTTSQQGAETGPEPAALRLFVSLSNQAAAALIQKQYAIFETLVLQALEIAHAAALPEQETLPALTNLATLYRETGRYQPARATLERALSIAERTLEPADARIFRLRRNLAFVQAATGRLEQAETLYNKALQSDAQVEPGEVALARSYLGDLYRKLGRYSESQDEYSAAGALADLAVNKAELRIALLARRGQLETDRGKYSRAESLLRESLAAAQKQYGPEHQQIAAILNNLGQLYTRKEKFGRAAEVLEKARAMWEKLQLPENPDLATLVNNLGAVDFRQRKYAAAEAHLQRALAIDEGSLGPNHASVARDLNNLGNLYLETARLREAEPLFERALSIYEHSAEAHPRLAEILQSLAELHRRQQQYDQAETLYQRAAVEWEKSLGAENPQLAQKLDLLAGAYRGMALYMDALRLEQRAAAIRASRKRLQDERTSSGCGRAGGVDGARWGDHPCL